MSQLKELGLGKTIKYDLLRYYLRERCHYKTPGRGLKDLINTIKRDPNPQKIIQELKGCIRRADQIAKERQGEVNARSKAKALPKGKAPPKAKAPPKTKAPPKAKALPKAKAPPNTIMDDEGTHDSDDEDKDDVMERLKGALALRKCKTSGSSYRSMVKRLLNALDKEY